MSFVLSRDAQGRREHRRRTNAVKRALREVNNQVAMLNYRVSARVGMRGVDLDCLDLIAVHGPLSPSGLARLSGIHRATVTGILDRLAAGGWVLRERGVGDRRAVVVRTRPERGRELFQNYAAMNRSMDAICLEYSASELDMIEGFLRRTSQAGRDAGEDLGRQVPT